MKHPVALSGLLTTLAVIVCVTVLAAVGKLDGDTAVAVIAALGGGGVGVAGGVTVPGKHTKGD